MEGVCTVDTMRQREHGGFNAVDLAERMDGQLTLIVGGKLHDIPDYVVSHFAYDPVRLACGQRNSRLLKHCQAAGGRHVSKQGRDCHHEPRGNSLRRNHTERMGENRPPECGPDWNDTDVY